MGAALSENEGIVSIALRFGPMRRRASSSTCLAAGGIGRKGEARADPLGEILVLLVAGGG